MQANGIMFMWPCIVINFFIIKPTICTNFTNLFWREINAHSWFYCKEMVLHCDVCQAGWTAVTAAEQMCSLHCCKLYSPELALENHTAYICKVIYYFPVSSCRIDRIKKRQHLTSLFCHCLLYVDCVTFESVFNTLRTGDGDSRF
jgi:hypothetical protein